MKTLTVRRFKPSLGRWVALGTLGVMTLGGVAAMQTPAQASPKNWKKATIGAGIVTGYGLLTGKGKIATIGGLATAGSYLMYRKSKKKSHHRHYRHHRHHR